VKEYYYTRSGPRLVNHRLEASDREIYSNNNKINSAQKIGEADDGYGKDNVITLMDIICARVPAKEKMGGKKNAAGVVRRRNNAIRKSQWKNSLLFCL